MPPCAARRSTVPREGLSSLVAMLQWRAAHQSDQDAFAFVRDGQRVTERLAYGDLRARALGLASGLRTQTSPGDRVLLLTPHSLDYVVGFFACLLADVIAVPLFPPRRNRSLKRIAAVAANAEPSLALTTHEALSGREQIVARANSLGRFPWMAVDQEMDGPDIPAVEPSQEAVAFLQYTSGSTGTPKGVMVTHRNLMHNQEAMHQAWNTGVSSLVSWLPMYHDMGLIGMVLQAVYCGIPAILMSPVEFLQTPLSWLRAISHFRATTSGAPNFAYALCADKIPKEQRRELDLRSWRVAFNGSEPVHASTLQRFQETFASAGLSRNTLFPAYGLAESTLMATAGTRSAEPVIREFDRGSLEAGTGARAGTSELGQTLVGCGKSIADQELAIVDPSTHRRCPEGDVGEVWLRSPSVAKGYWKNAEATRQTFQAKIIEEGPRSYLRTGDLGFLDQGELYVTGRCKDLLIVRGRNLYPQDLEACAAEAHPALHGGRGAAFVVDEFNQRKQEITSERKHERNNDDQRLVLLHEASLKPGTDHAVLRAVREAVEEEFEVELHSVVLLRMGTLPRTTSGKVQRRQSRREWRERSLRVLAEWVRGDDEDSVVASDPRDWFSQQLREAEASSFDESLALRALGFDSLRWMTLLHRIEDRFQVLVPFADILDGLTGRELLERLESADDRISSAVRGSGQRQPPASEDRSGTSQANRQSTEVSHQPLSFGQESLWFLHALAPESSAYHVPLALGFSGTLDRAKLHESLAILLQRHPALRTVFPATDGQPQRVVRETAPLPLSDHNASTGNPATLDRRIRREIARPFDLETGPLIRFSLFPRHAGGDVLLMVAHHLVVDYWSMSILMEQWQRLYRGVESAEPAASSEWANEDHARWQQNWIRSDEAQTQLEYWSDQLAHLPTVDLPTKAPRPREPSASGRVLPATLSSSLVAKLEELSQQHDTTLFVTTLAAFAALLTRYTDQQDLPIGTLTAGRHRSAWKSVVGYLVNPLVLRCKTNGNPRFDELLERVHRITSGALRHQDFPFDRLVETLAPRRDSNRTPLFQILFLWQNAHHHQGQDLSAFAMGRSGGQLQFGDLSVESVPLPQEVTQFDWSLVLASSGDEVLVNLEYKNQLFDAELAEGFQDHYRAFLESIAQNPHQRLSEIPIFDREERIALEPGPPSPPESPSTVLSLLNEHPRQRPEQPSVTDSNTSLTWRELHERAEAWSAEWQRRGVGAEALVGLWMERSVELVAAWLGIWKAGAAVLPFDDRDPPERVLRLAKQAKAIAMVTDRPGALTDDRDSRSPEIPVLTTIDPRQGKTMPSPVVDPDQLAYATFTSGSTGTPKAVQVTHANVASAFRSWEKEYQLVPGLSHLQMARASFDVFVGDLVRALASGGRLVICPWQTLLEPQSLLSLLHRESVGVAEFVPSVLNALLDHLEECDERLPPMQILAVGSDVFPGSDQRRLRERADPHTRLVNSYGVTEATIDSTFHPMIGDQPRSTVPIGTAFAGTTLAVTDSAGSLVPSGVPGELWIGGAGVSRGYLNRPDLTAERFVPDPWSSTPGARCYRTGDRVRRSFGGPLEFVGRSDQQVKIRGIRVELSEVRIELCRLPEVVEAEVLATPREDGPRRLLGYLVLRDPDQSMDAVRTQLRTRVPEAMVPAKLIRLHELPRNANGKVDRRQLPRDEVTFSKPTAREPETAVERALIEVLADVLNVPIVSVEDNYFDLGGDSILTIRYVARARRRGIEFKPEHVFQHQTARELARHCRVSPDSSPQAVSTEPSARTTSPAPFSMVDLDATQWSKVSSLLDEEDEEPA